MAACLHGETEILAPMAGTKRLSQGLISKHSFLLSFFWADVDQKPKFETNVAFKSTPELAYFDSRKQDLDQ